MGGYSTKQFLVVAYDIVSNKRRNQLVKLLKGYGTRANYSVFECRIKKKNIPPLQEKIAQIINCQEDSVLYYPLCKNCVENREEDGFRRKRKKQGIQFIV